MVRPIKVVLIVAVVIAAFAGAGIGRAAPANCGTGGSSANFAGSCDTSSNDTQCGTNSTGTPAGARVMAGASGVEVCNQDGGAVPLEGRVGGDAACQCIYADGGDNNPAPADGWLRIDSGGVHCRPATGGPSYNSGGGTPQDCG